MHNFRKIETVDPKTIFKPDIILIKPYYLNYSFLMNFVAIGILIYVIWSSDNNYQVLGCYLLIGLSTTIMLNELRSYNTIQIDIKENKLTISPNFLFSFFVKTRVISLKEINKTITSSSSGIYRRFYLIIALISGREMKIISSGKKETITQISNLIADLRK